MTYTIKSNRIAEIREGRNDNRNYDYKEYVLGENATEIKAVRIPINAPGIKAMVYGGTGIESEHDQIYLDSDDTITTLFDIRYAAANHADHLTEQVQCLTALHKDATEEVERLRKMYDHYCIENRALKATNYDQAQELITLKAKLYDLMTVGA
ncbi:MAG: hypothetical protein FWC70_10820 [Defluviitaleaceae bacterium]|nr:hypothetical protein [Defluviitaleaceae bacterium]